MHKYKILMHKKVCRFTNLHVYIHVRMYFHTFTCTSFLYTFCIKVHDAFLSLTYLFSHINRHEMGQMIFNCNKIMSIGLKKEQEFVSFAFSCSVSLVAQSVWSMLELRLSFVKS